MGRLEFFGFGPWQNFAIFKRLRFRLPTGSVFQNGRSKRCQKGPSVDRRVHVTARVKVESCLLAHVPALTACSTGLPVPEPSGTRAQLAPGIDRPQRVNVSGFSFAEPIWPCGVHAGPMAVPSNMKQPFGQRW